MKNKSLEPIGEYIERAEEFYRLEEQIAQLEEVNSNLRMRIAELEDQLLKRDKIISELLADANRGWDKAREPMGEPTR
jgi:uncharacterized coiled-coil DUF342 family protein